MPSGGARPFRTKSKPKPVSGPGKLSERTDMEVPANGQYGYRKQTQDIKSSAPLAKAPQPSTGSVNYVNQNPVTPLFEPTQFPGVPVTNGYPFGPGESPEPQINPRFAMIQKYQDQLDTMAAQSDAPQSFIDFWNYTKAAARGE